MLIVIAKILLAPILLIQGLYVRKTIIKLPEASGARAGQRGDGPTLKLLILGDSAAAGVGAACQEQALSGSVVKALESHFTVQWTLLAKTGETTDSMRIQLMQADLDAFDVVLISLGVNDTTSGKSVQMYEQQTVALIQQLKNQLDAEHIIFSGLPPMGNFLPFPIHCVGFLVYVADSWTKTCKILQRLRVVYICRWNWHPTLHLSLKMAFTRDPRSMQFGGNTPPG